MIDPKIRCIVTHNADQHLSRAAEVIPQMGDERLIEFTLMLANLINRSAHYAREGISPDTVTKMEISFRNLGFLLVFAQVGVEQAALSALAQAEKEEAEGNVE